MLFKYKIYEKTGYVRSFILPFVIILFTGVPLFAQDQVQILSDEDPIVFSMHCEIQPDDPSRVWDTVKEFASLLKYPGKIENKALIDDFSGTIKVQFGFYLYQKLSIMKQVDGAVFADLDIILRNNQVISSIHTIYFIDYIRDRYGKFSPRSSKKYTLEYLRKKRKDDVWKEHFRSIEDNMDLLLTKLEKSVLKINEVSAK